MGRVVLTVNNEYGDEKNSYEKGETFYHETFHAIDGGYATRWGTMLSHTYTNEEGKTLYDVLKSEKRAFGSARIAEVKTAKEKDTDEWMVANNITTREAIDSIVKNWNEQQERINQFTDWRERDKVAHSDEYQKAYRDFNLLKSQRMVYGSRLNKKYGFISDIMSQWNDDIGMGHTMSYWKRDKFNSSSEFFAEVGACGATNKAALEVVRKYFPKSVAFAEQLIDGIKTGNIKAR